MYDEYDEEVAAVEAAEEAAVSGRTVEDKDAEIKPFLPKCALTRLSVCMYMSAPRWGLHRSESRRLSCCKPRCSCHAQPAAGSMEAAVAVRQLLHLAC